MTMKHGRGGADKLFWEIRALMVRTLRAADRLSIHDKQSFEVGQEQHNAMLVLSTMKNVMRRLGYWSSVCVALVHTSIRHHRG